MTKMRMGRRAGCGIVVGLLLTATLGGTAGAADPVKGVGHGVGGVGLLNLTIGDKTDAVPNFLDVAIVGENSATTIDPADGVARALEQLHPIIVGSAAPDPLGAALRGLTVDPLQTDTTGAEQTSNNAAIDLDTVTGGNANGLLSGQINPAALRSVVSAVGAESSASATLSNLALLGGLLKSDTATLSLGSNALTTSSQSIRGVKLNQVDVLNLEGLLNLLGVSVDDLPLQTVLGLIDSLHLTDAIAGLGVNIPAITNTTTGQLDSLLATVNACDALDPLSLGYATQFLALGCAAAYTAIQTAVTSVETVLNGLNQNVVDSIFNTLGGAALLSINGVEATTTAIARDTVANSVADVTAKIGGITVGGIDLGAVDVNATAQQVVALAGSLTSQVNGILALISPQLANLIDVKLLQETSGVSAAGTKITATSKLTAVTVTITPPDICALANDVAALASATPVGPVPTALPGEVTTLLSGLGVSVSCNVVSAAGAAQAAAVVPVTALTQPITVQAVDIGNAATFTPAAATPVTPATPALPRTGGSTVLLSLFAAMAAAAALGLRRVVRTTSARR